MLCFRMHAAKFPATQVVQCCGNYDNFSVQHQPMARATYGASAPLLTSFILNRDSSAREGLVSYRRSPMISVTVEPIVYKFTDRNVR